MTDHPDRYDQACAEERARRMREQCADAGGLFSALNDTEAEELNRPAEDTPERRALFDRAKAMQTRHFDGATYDPEHDQARLNRLFDRVLKVASSGGWYTLAELHEKCGGSEASCSARLRDARKPEFGGHTVERRHRGDAVDGLYEYRVVLRRPHGQEAA